MKRVTKAINLLDEAMRMDDIDPYVASLANYRINVAEAVKELKAYVQNNKRRR